MSTSMDDSTLVEEVPTEEELKILNELNQFAAKELIHIPFPARVSRVSGADASGDERAPQPLRTDVDFIQHRLIENGLAFDDFQSLSQVTEALSVFVTELERSGCYETVQVAIGKNPKTLEEEEEEKEHNVGKSSLEGLKGSLYPSAILPGKLDILLNEKKWYKIYIGGGIKQDTKDTTFQGAKAQLETNLSLLNLKGCTDQTRFSYAVDQASTTRFTLSHDAPLYSFFAKDSLLQNSILLSSGGSKTHGTLRAMMDTLDFEHSRSYKEHQRLFSFRMCNIGYIPRPEMAAEVWKSLDWSLLWRDIVPRRYPKSPFACDASPDIVSHTGRSIKHSLLYEYRTNNKLDGLDVSCSAELAGPPGDVGFAKWEGALSYKLPLFPTLPPTVDGISLQFSFHSGLVKSLRFGGLCNDGLCVSDRFFIGGPLQLRGFQYSGIGPRATTGGSLVPAGSGDSLGGELFYTSMLAASAPFPFHTAMREAGFRLMCFVNTGTLSGWGVPLTSLIRSTRASVGAGVTLSTSMGKLEATYSFPLRYGPRDIRQQAQFGFGFVIGG